MADDSDLTYRLKLLEDKILDSKQFSWGNAASLGMLFIIVVGAFWGLAYGPIADKFTRLDGQMRENRDEIKALNDFLSKRRDEIVTNASLEKELRTLRGRDQEFLDNIRRIDNEAVRKGELAATKDDLTKSISIVEKRASELRADIEEITRELIRRRIEFVEQVEFRAFEKRFDGVEKAQDAHFKLFLTKDAFDAWKTERDKTINAMQKQIEANHSAIHGVK